MQAPDLRRSRQGKVAFTVFGLLLVGAWLPEPSNAFHVANGQALRAANGRRPVSGVICGFRDAFQGDAKVVAHMDVAEAVGEPVSKSRDLSGTTPTFSPSVYAAPTKSKCIPVTVDFDLSAGNTPLPRGKYVSNEWADYALTLSTMGGLEGESRPRLFNTSIVGNDPDLGSPNSKCNPAGPGIGEGGEPTGAGPNCNPLGNVLIIQNSDSSVTIPDDIVRGGTIFFDFKDEPYVYEIGLLDMDYDASVTVVYRTASGQRTNETFEVPLKGDNSVQTLIINKANVRRVSVDMIRSGAVTFISYCYNIPATAVPSDVPSRDSSE
jgi:hypothetical protein